MASNYLMPSSKGRRGELDNTRTNGRVVNPPRFAQLGGLKSARTNNAMTKNSMSIKRPGDTV